MSNPNNPDGTGTIPGLPHTMPAEIFANLGAPDLAYVRSVATPEGIAWGIYAANGAHLGWAPARDLAFAAAVQHELHPVSAH